VSLAGDAGLRVGWIFHSSQNYKFRANRNPNSLTVTGRVWPRRCTLPIACFSRARLSICTQHTAAANSKHQLDPEHRFHAPCRETWAGLTAVSHARLQSAFLWAGRRQTPAATRERNAAGAQTAPMQIASTVSSDFDQYMLVRLALKNNVRGILIGWHVVSQNAWFSSSPWDMPKERKPTVVHRVTRRRAADPTGALDHSFQLLCTASWEGPGKGCLRHGMHGRF